MNSAEMLVQLLSACLNTVDHTRSAADSMLRC